MRTAFITFLILLLTPSASFAHGAIVVGLHPDFDRILTTISKNDSSKDYATNNALNACTAARSRNCSILLSFENACATFYLGSNTHKYYPATGATASEASTNAHAACGKENVTCFSVLDAAVCDRTPQPKPTITTTAIPATQNTMPETSPRIQGLLLSMITLAAVAAISLTIMFATAAKDKYQARRHSNSADSLGPQQPESPLPRPTAEQTYKAKEHLKNAHDICVEGEDLWFKNKKFDTEDYIKAMRTLGYAAEDVVKARGLDPNAELTVKDKHQGIITVTADTMTARLLFMEGQMSIGSYLTEEEIRKGIETLKQHLIFRPYHAYAYALLAKAYTRVFERQHALDAIAKALELDPNDLQIRQVRDDLADPTIGVPKPKGYPILAILGWSMVPLLVPVGIVLSFFVTGFEGFGFLTAIGGGVLWFIRHRRDTNKIYARALGIEEPKRTL